MAKKFLWKDNTMPPTNYLWLRLDDAGNTLGLYKHNGNKWIKTSDGISGSGSEITYTDTSGKQHTITIEGTNSDGTVILQDSDGAETVTIVNKLVWSEYER